MSTTHPNHRWARAPGPHKKRLDRYSNISPWNNNRIRLRVPEGHFDYINASPIALTSTAASESDAKTQQTDRYIAMQGPVEETASHVWRMVVEQLKSPGVIVMLTEPFEGSVEKCWPYFPRSEKDPPLEINENDEFGDGFSASVRCEGLEETPAGSAIELRKLIVSVRKAKDRAGDAKRSAQDDRPLSADVGTPSPAVNGAHDEEDEADDEEHMVFSPAHTRSLEAFGNSIWSPSLSTKHGKFAGTQSASKVDDCSTFQSRGNADAPEDVFLGQSKVAGSQRGDEEGDTDHIIWHFLYKRWPDFGVPEGADVDSFFTLMRLSREKNVDPQNPRIVHCSAGVGRTGTFIALEHLMRELDAGALGHWDALDPASKNKADRIVAPIGSAEVPAAVGSSSPVDQGSPMLSPDGRSGSRSDGGKDLIFDTVNQLREQRRHMVQAESQYAFIYHVLRKLWQDRYHGTSEPAPKRLEVDPFVGA